MSKATNYLEKLSVIEEDDLGETFESVSINDALTAIKIQEYETMCSIFANENSDAMLDRYNALKKELKHLLNRI